MECVEVQVGWRRGQWYSHESWSNLGTAFSFFPELCPCPAPRCLRWEEVHDGSSRTVWRNDISTAQHTTVWSLVEDKQSEK